MNNSRPFQDWEPVIIRSNKAKKEQDKKISSAPPKPKVVEDESGMPPKQEQYSHRMLTALQEARKLKGITQAELAKKLNIETKIIQDLEANKSPFNRKLYSSIMRHLGIDSKSIKEIINGTSENN